LLETCRHGTYGGGYHEEPQILGMGDDILSGHDSLHGLSKEIGGKKYVGFIKEYR
jgi:hypothetical protein